MSTFNIGFYEEIGEIIPNIIKYHQIRTLSLLPIFLLSSNPIFSIFLNWLPKIWNGNGLEKKNQMCILVRKKISSDLHYSLNCKLFVRK